MAESFIVAIPDVNGEIRRLERLIDLAIKHWPTAKLVFLGNYINQGRDSAAVLRAVKHQTERGHIALRGDAEEDLLDYLSITSGLPTRWSGGECETIRSFEREARDWFETPRSLACYLAGNGMLDWLEGLPIFYRDKDLVFTSAPVASDDWNRNGVPAEWSALKGGPMEFDEEGYGKYLGAPPGCFPVCGHERVLSRWRRDGTSDSVPKGNSKAIAFITDRGDVLKAGEATRWPRNLGKYAPMLFPHGLYLDCGCDEERPALVEGIHEGLLVAAVLKHS